METFIGVKIVKAEPMTRREYNDYRGWETPENEKDVENEDGFLIEYEDTGHPNHPSHLGYISWSPENVFVEVYREINGMTFGLALEALKKGYNVCRAGWNGKGQFVKYFVPETDEYEIKEGIFKRSPYFYLKNAQDTLIPWVPSMGDCSAEDWQIVK